MIKPVDNIPQTVDEERKSYRAKIRADIQSAIDSGVRKFEFVGDYNFSYLRQYARNEADKITLKALFPLLRAAADAHGWRFLPGRYLRRDGYIKITQHKEPDRIHVYCEINPEALAQYVDAAVRQELEARKRA